jgi:hypothetical protein
VICGGVATSNGDFLCTMTVDRCLPAAAYPDAGAGAKAATVGGFVSWESWGDVGPSLDVYVPDLDIDVAVIQSVSGHVRSLVAERVWWSYQRQTCRVYGSVISDYSLELNGFGRCRSHQHLQFGHICPRDSTIPPPISFDNGRPPTGLHSVACEMWPSV